MKLENLVNILANTKAIEILSLVITFVCLASFCAVFTILFRNYYKHNISDIKGGKDDIELIDNALYLEQQSKNKVKKVFKIIGKVLSWTLFGVVVVGFGFSLASRFTGNNMLLGDSAYIVIASGSMEKAAEGNTYIEENGLTNQIMTYDMVEIEKVKDASDIKLYDVIAYKANDGRTIVHRVVEIKPDGTFVTQGDAVNNKDNVDSNLYSGSLPFDKVVGRYTGNRVPLLGLFVIFLQSNAGIITIVAIVYCMIMFDTYRLKCDKAINERTTMLIDLINYDMQKEEADDVENHFKQQIVYKGETYIFEDGKFVSKGEEVPEKAKDFNENDMVVIKEKEGQEETVEVRNVKKENLETDNKNTDKE